MRYGQEDRIESDKQIKEFLKLKIIQESDSLESSPTFIIRNHAKIKGGKALMVINHKELNEYTKFDG